MDIEEELHERRTTLADLQTCRPLVITKQTTRYKHLWRMRFPFKKRRATDYQRDLDHASETAVASIKDNSKKAGVEK